MPDRDAPRPAASAPHQGDRLDPDIAAHIRRQYGAVGIFAEFAFAQGDLIVAIIIAPQRDLLRRNHVCRHCDHQLFWNLVLLLRQIVITDQQRQLQRLCAIDALARLQQGDTGDGILQQQQGSTGDQTAPQNSKRKWTVGGMGRRWLAEQVEGVRELTALH